MGLIVLIGLLSGPQGRLAASPSPTAPAHYLLANPQPAPPIELTASDGSHFSLASRRGTPQIVFFGYTHCADVCPLTIGTVGEALAEYAPGAQAVFVTVDPERDTVAWLSEYARYTPAGFSFVTGSATEIAATATAWGVRYAREDTADPQSYEMSHTADVFVVDAASELRARIPFGADARTMTAVLNDVAATTAALPSAVVPQPTASVDATESGVEELSFEMASSSVWSGGDSPMIFALHDRGGRLDDSSAAVTLMQLDEVGRPTGAQVAATAVNPPGESKVWFVATVDIVAAGTARFAVSATIGDRALAGTLTVTALDPGTTAALGEPAPTIATPTLADVGGNSLLISTDAAPDPRLYNTSTATALAQHQPFVLVVDSARFRVTAACGKALVMARYLVDRWPSVPFIHLEPYAFTIVTDTQVLTGGLDAPVQVPAADAWGIGGAPWGAKSMPWIFIVDGDGIVRAKYQGVIGTDEVDVMISALTNR